MSGKRRLFALLDKAAGVASDSRQVQPGYVFLALPGSHYHGLDFYQQVRAAGALAVAYDPDGVGLISAQPDCPLLPVENLRAEAAAIADHFYDYPSERLELIGVTGTDGKTSCSHFIAQCLAPCGLLGTVGYGLYGQLQTASHTTPDTVALRRWLADVQQRGARYAAMEVSSHALAQNRVAGLDFAVAVLTHLSRDHLDYHGDEAAYAAAKRRLFSEHNPSWSVLNADDAFGRQLAAECSANARSIVYSLGQPFQGGSAEFVRGSELRLTASGLALRVDSSWGKGELTASLLGRFNASNLLATLATLLALDVPFADALQRASQVVNAPGRMERFGGGDRPLAVVDYAHTPYALEQALRALREHLRGRLWCVFGAGGDRDPGKRPLMGAAAERWADVVVVTDDNPRGEDPQAIIDAVLAGMEQPRKARRLRGRDQAIAVALAEAKPGDIVLIAGKGHEDYQLIGEQRLAFSDREWVVRCLTEQAA